MKNFSDYFDKVYLINLLERPERKKFIIEELKALGIYDDLISSNKLEIIEAIKMPWITEKEIEFLNKEGKGNLFSCGSHNVGLYNCTCEHYRILKRSLLKDYKRIMIIEDDACFVKNIEAIMKALETMPRDFDILHVEGFYWPDNNPPTWDEITAILADSPIDGEWRSSEELHLWATACLIYSQSGMKRYLDLQDNYLRGVDYYTCMIGDRCYYYSFPLVMQENKRDTHSDIANNYNDSYEKNNVYLSKTNNNMYYHMKDFK